MKDLGFTFYFYVLVIKHRVSTKHRGPNSSRLLSLELLPKDNGFQFSGFLKRIISTKYRMATPKTEFELLSKEAKLWGVSSGSGFNDSL